MGIYLIHCTQKENMQVEKAKSFQLYFSFFFVLALDKSRFGYFPSNKKTLKPVLERFRLPDMDELDLRQAFLRIFRAYS